MGILDELGSLFQSLLAPAPTSGPSRASSRPTTHAPQKLTPGDVHKGTVRYVGAKHANIDSNGFQAVVFRTEMARHFVQDAAEVVSIGDAVEFVLVAPSDRGGWIASLSAVDEASARESMAHLKPGDELDGTVIALEARHAVLACEGFKAHVPLAEMSWGRVRGPGDVMGLHRSYRVRVLDVRLPDLWLTNKHARKAHVIASLRDCQPCPESPLIRMPFSAMPFRLWAEPRKPRTCDSVMLYLLDELDRGTLMTTIRDTTGLPANALARMLSVLEGEGLVSGVLLTGQGRAIAASLARASSHNRKPLRGLFASAAPGQKQFLPPATSTADADYPRSWPSPPRARRSEESFLQSFGDALPVASLRAVIDASAQSQFTSLLDDHGLMVLAQRDGRKPSRTVWLDVPDHWILAGLHSAFEPLGPTPFCPADVADHARQLLLVKLTVAAPHTQTEQTVYLEPWTRTCWTKRRDGRIREFERDETDFPALPDPVVLGSQVTASIWVVLEIKS